MFKEMLKFTYTSRGYCATFYIHPSQLQFKVVHSAVEGSPDSYFILFEGKLQQVDKPEGI